MKTVLIIAYECRPFNRPGSTIGAQRPYQFAKWLPEFGWTAIVICSDFSTRRSIDIKTNWQPAIRSIVTKKLAEKCPEESTIIGLPTTKYTTIADKIWFKNVDVQPDGSYIATLKGNIFTRKLSSFLKLFTGDYSEDILPVGKIAIDQLVKHVKIDCIVGEHSPDAGIRLANWACNKYKIKWLADFRDPVFQPFRGISYFLSKLSVKRTLASCSATVNVNDYWASIDQHNFRKPAFTISNGYDSQEVQVHASVEFHKRLVIYCMGNISFPAKTEPFFKALYQLSLSHTGLFSFFYRGNLAPFFDSELKKYNLSDVADVKQKQHREVILQELPSADILLLFGYVEPNPVKEMLNGYIPGKTFEYMALQKPILSIGHPNDMLGILLQSTGTGIASLEVKEIHEFFAARIEEKAKNGKLVSRCNYEVLKRYSRRETAHQLSKLFAKIS